MSENLRMKAHEFVESNWEQMLEDLSALVRIPSIRDAEQAKEGQPFGSQPRRALDTALAISERLGFKTGHVDGAIGYADIQGATDTQIGIIGHVDVVPAGPGWTFEPFELTRREGFLLGRGVADDKGPSVMALYAMRYWLEQGTQLPYTIRFIFGSAEETGMQDLEYYQRVFDDPAALFTPDAEFPVGYGEKGLIDGVLTSQAFQDGRILDFQGGTVTNAVPGIAHVIVGFDSEEDRNEAMMAIQAKGKESLSLSIVGGDGADFERNDSAHTDVSSHVAGAGDSREHASKKSSGRYALRIDAQGRSAHASLPHLGESAIAMLVNLLLEENLCTPEERAFLELQAQLVNHTDGSGLGIACNDADFGPPTIVGGTVAMKEARIIQTFDARYPTTIRAEAVRTALEERAAAANASADLTKVVDPFLIDANSPFIQALLGAYREVTGCMDEPFTMGGATYARNFTCAASFGPLPLNEEKPDWVGGMHGPDEGVAEETLKQACEVYILALGALMELDLNG